MIDKFDDIRPYNASEIPAAMQRIAQSEHFPKFSKFIFPDRNVEEVRDMVSKLRTTYEFQKEVMYYVNEQIVNKSISKLTYSGLEYLDPAKNYLFISNHRDIMLDSSLLQYIFFKNGLRTTEITFGSNLMRPQLVVDIGKANKMFKVERSCNIRDFIKNSLHLSDYIRFTIREKGESIWIAQRNGRTKDGNDVTDQGIIKMFCMSDQKNLSRSAAELNIVPIAISYQIESCDLLKTMELYKSRVMGKYVKQPGEDLNSILTGIMQQKGCVNISVCEPLKNEELEFDFNFPNEFYKNVAALIDKRIYANYKLFDNNYAAHDILSGNNTYSDFYTPGSIDLLLQRICMILSQIDGDKEELKDIFLGIYANPVDNALKIK